MKRIFALLAGLGLAAGVYATGSSTDAVQVWLQVAPSNDVSQVDLQWTADSGAFYEIFSTTNLATEPWTLAVEHPVNATSLAAQVSLLSSDKSRFFQVRPLDTQGPTITARYPGPNVVHVGLDAPLTIQVADPSGVDTNAFRLKIDDAQTLLPDSSGVSVTPSQFLYDPALAGTEWGVNGATVTVTFVCADLRENQTLETWSFVLESPAIIADNTLVLGSPPPLEGQELQVMTSQPMGLEVVSIHADRVVLSYTGKSHGLSIGMLLVNGDFDNIFYRRITGLVDDAGNQRVTAYTDDVPFSEVITAGSFDSADFVWVDENGQEITLDLMPLATFGRDIPFASANVYSIDTDWGPVSFIGTAGYDFSGKISFSTELNRLKVTQVEAGVEASLDVMLDAQLVFDATTAPVNQSIALLGDGVRLGRATAWIYGIPVRVALWLDMDLCVSSEKTGAFTLGAEADASVSFFYTVGYNRDTRWTRDSDGSFSYSLPPVQVSDGMEGYAYVYVRPKVSVRMYEAIGVDLDYRRGPLLTGAYVSSQGRYRFGLYDKRSVNLGVWLMDLPSFLDGFLDTDDLPSWPLWGAETLERTWYWPDVPLSAPDFTLDPQSRTASPGEWVVLSASAAGNPAPSYQWYHNGKILRGRTSATLGFTMGWEAVGTYHVVAHNNRGTATSQSASITFSGGTPAGMVLIPGGTISGTNPLADGESHDDDYPATYNITVGSFYMDRYLVTKALWDQVRNNPETVARGYDMYEGFGQGANHPVHSVSWFDAIKWLNARSELAGREPVYYKNAAMTQVFRSGDGGEFPGPYSEVYVKASANGFRLPSMDQWEYAARGGLRSRRFPWGNTINHNHANYRANGSAYSYDTSPYTTWTYHPDSGSWPHTMAVGLFAPNGYGLYDMAGNLWEWNYNWHPSYVGSGRVLRGGSWSHFAGRCRVGDRLSHWPGYARNFVGFRAVLPPGQ